MTAPRPERRRRNRRVVTALMVLGSALALSAVGVLLWYQSLCPGATCVDLSIVLRSNLNQASIVYDRQGREIGQFSVESRRVTSIDSLPSVVPAAFLAVEDRHFYEHHGVDWRRVGGSLFRNIFRMRTAQGFSTITMQLARNTYPDFLPAREKTLKRKAREVRVARAIEKNLTKREILERYLNTIGFGQGAYGIDVAARTYFGKPSTDLTLPEAALLAALPKSPAHYNPVRYPAAALQRRNLVLGEMVLAGAITRDAATAAQATPLGLHLGSDSTTKITAQVAPYFLEDVRKSLAVLGPGLYRKGYKIYTTLDIDAQAAVEAALEHQMTQIEGGKVGDYHGTSRAAVLALAGDTTPAGRAMAVALQRGQTPYLQGAAVLVEADSGDVLALVGGRSFDESHFDRATQARRQPGSAFKPFVYAAALDKGYLGEDLVSDEPITVPLPGGGEWSPGNFDRDPRDTISLYQAIALSRNRATVRVALDVGLDAVVETAHTMGLTTVFPEPADAYPSIILGAREVQMLDLVAAYTPVARIEGVTVRPRFIRAVVDPAAGAIVYRDVPRIRPALTPAVAAGLRGLLQGVVDHGTGNPVRQAGYTGPAAGKTGTTNNTSDVWFIGATPDYVAGVWMGFDTPSEVMSGRDGTGGRLAAPVWANIMKAIGAATPRHSWRRPADTTAVRPRKAAPPPADSEMTPVPHLTTDSARLCVVRRPDGEPETGSSNLVPCASLKRFEHPVVPDTTAPTTP